MTRVAALGVVGLAVAFVSAVGDRAGAAPVPKHSMLEVENADLAALQGKWALSGVAVNGSRVEIDRANEGTTLEVCGAKFVYTLKQIRTTGTLKLDTTTSPRRLSFLDCQPTIDGKPIELANQPKEGGKIYKIDGDTLVTAGRANGGLPADFDGSRNGPDDPKTVTSTFTRVKK
jgi:uncharacterized protein (TIGR03067 family)